MKFNTAVKEEKKEAFSYFMKLANKKQIIEVKKISPARTIRQNSYLHLIIAAFGSNFGYRLDEAKALYKRVNKDLYVYKKQAPGSGEMLVFVKSSADLTKEEMMMSIDKFRRYSAENGYPLPEAENNEWLRQLENEVEKHNALLNG